ncbi:ABC transporter ATP-binding protein [Spirochaeta thermophila]|uniref:Nod factor export ATP-binding protein I n=1 Tax=Winmispira thermophila (strain ATCC 49972 / DSM 6192 / RI 19.B1) TaxID=665571 RepID=E0RQR2_WINT6|nr:ABC transporter ATP-binding protein [Spirochaeta thermophila]ADN02968.1 Nod factor export ATP-binding protein I [Spirochaeta thermophila DSM 6192]
METIVRVEHCHKTYGTFRALTDLSFSAGRGECVALLGPNGAGKTTMIKILYGKARRDPHPETRVEVFGLDPEVDELAIKQRTGVVQQENNLDDELNVVQNLKIFARFYRMKPSRARTRIEELLEFMELSEKRDQPVKALSGGMKRRLVIARALLNQPELLFLDEPTTGLDPQVRQLIWDRIRALTRQGVTVLLTTHYMEEAYHIADRIIIMDHGTSLLEGNPRELVEKHIEPHVVEVLIPSYTLPSGDSLRVEHSEERTLIYAPSREKLEALTAELPAGSYFIRPSTLEDLFLKITGRRLKDGQ